MIKKILLMISMIILSACSLNEDNLKPEFSSDYICYTYTHVTDEVDKFEMDTYLYDLNSYKSELVSSINYNAQYPLTYYDKSDNVVYYTQRKGESHNDEVYVYDCKTKKTKKLTEGIYAVNAIYKVGKDKLALIAMTSSRYIHLVFLNTYTLELDEIYKDDYNITAQYYDQKRNKMILAGFMADEEYKIRDEYNSDLTDTYIVDNTIYEYDIETGVFELVFHSNTGYIVSLVGNEDYIYFKENDYISSDKRIIMYDCHTKEKSQSIDFKGVYELIASSDNSDYIIYSNDRKLKMINLNNGEIENLFHDNVEGIINNGFLGYGI